MHVFDGIGGINDFTHLRRKVKIADKIVPVVSPGFNEVTVLIPPFFG